MFILIISFIAGEYWWRMEGAIYRLTCKKEVESGGKEQPLRGYINHEDYNKLPEFTWEEINERVQRGVRFNFFLYFITFEIDQKIYYLRKFVGIPGSM